METWPSDFKNVARIASNVQKLSAVCSNIADKVLEENYGFGNSQFKILWVLYHHEEGVAQKVIAGWRNQTEAAISRQMGILKKRGLIERRKSRTDKRAYVIALTPEGRKFTDSATRTLVSNYAPHFSVLSSAEQKRLGDMLEKLFYQLCDRKLGKGDKHGEN